MTINIIDVLDYVIPGPTRMDDMVTEKWKVSNEKVCVDCGEANDPNYRMCTNCSGRSRRHILYGLRGSFTAGV